MIHKVSMEAFLVVASYCQAGKRWRPFNLIANSMPIGDGKTGMYSLIVPWQLSDSFPVM